MNIHNIIIKELLLRSDILTNLLIIIIEKGMPNHPKFDKASPKNLFENSTVKLSLMDNLELMKLHKYHKDRVC